MSYPRPRQPRRRASWCCQIRLGERISPTIIGRAVKTLLGLVGAFALLVFVYAGIVYMTAAGREDAITKAKETMKYAFFGLLIIFFAYAITNYFVTALAG